MSEQRIINNRLVVRQAATCPVTGLSYFAVQVYHRVANPSAGLRTLTGAHLIVTDGATWEASQDLTASPAQRFQAILNGLYPSLFALPRVPSDAEKEAAKLRELGLHHTATMVEKAHPSAPIEIIGDDKSLFAVNAEQARIGKDGMRILVFQADEIRDYLRRHVAGDGGEFGDFAKVEWSDDASWCPEVAGPSYASAAALVTGYGLVRSRFGVYRPAHDNNQDSRTPAHASHADTFIDRRRNRGDWLEVTTLVIKGKPTQTVMHSSRDNFATTLPSVAITG